MRTIGSQYIRVLVALVLFASTVSVAPASAIPIGGPWQEFSFQTVGAQVTGCQPADPNGLFCIPSNAGNSTFAAPPAWTFTAPLGGAILIVTDAFTAGDMFQVLDFGRVIGTTSSVAASPHNCGSNPVPCSNDVRMSHGRFLLTAGNHSITIIDLADPYGAGGAYFNVKRITPVPEPTSLALALSGFAAAFFRRNRKRRELPNR